MTIDEIFTIQTIAFAILTIEKTILETCDIWDTDYNSDNWEPEFMTIFVTWQLIVTLDSIRNSCDVLLNPSQFFFSWENGDILLSRKSCTLFHEEKSPKNSTHISGDTLLRDNRRLIGRSLIVVARQVQNNRD